jgi:hypothetical protein
MVYLVGHLIEAALRNADRDAVTTAGATVIGLGVGGAVAMPRSGFVVAPAAGYLLLRRGRSLGRT